MTRGADHPSLEPLPDSLSEEAARNTLALNPLVGLRGKDLVDSAAILLKAMVNEPIVGRRAVAGILRRTRENRRGSIQSDPISRRQALRRRDVEE